MTQDFQAFYPTIQPLLNQLEAERKQVLLKTLYIVIGGGWLTGLLALLLRQGLTVGISGAVVGAVIAYGFLILPYRRKHKRQLMERLVKFVNLNLFYDADMGVGQDAYMSSRLFPRRYDRLHQEDLISGMVGKTWLTVAEIHSEYCSQNSKGNRQWHTIFQGLFYILDFPKSFRGSTFVMPDHNSWLGGFGDFIQRFDGRGDLVKLEDPDFERAFVVHSTDQVEARYLLSTSMMQRILRLSARGQVSLAFTGGNLYVALASERNRFEPHFNLFKPINGLGLADQLDELHEVLSIVDELDLNKRIWK
jgi:Protein of unknown function (DUF3137)